jgi:hypothetical protein
MLPTILFNFIDAVTLTYKLIRPGAPKGARAYVPTPVPRHFKLPVICPGAPKGARACVPRHFGGQPSALNSVTLFPTTEHSSRMTHVTFTSLGFKNEFNKDSCKPPTVPTPTSQVYKLHQKVYFTLMESVINMTLFPTTEHNSRSN